MMMGRQFGGGARAAPRLTGDASKCWIITLRQAYCRAVLGVQLHFCAGSDESLYRAEETRQAQTDLGCAHRESRNPVKARKQKTGSLSYEGLVAFWCLWGYELLR